MNWRLGPQKARGVQSPGCDAAFSAGGLQLQNDLFFLGSQAKLGQRPGFDLSNPLFGDAQLGANFLERTRGLVSCFLGTELAIMQQTRSLSRGPPDDEIQQ